ncbi:hypothetical protein A3D60_00070 [Candidatus Uhrbacteria bacterium RIFCSPHIGHO2_02_FULL_47_29]|uniref:Haloacid dehalogenase n=1 Tax=Candidatus Uhrbacteria bacterium RIFCSPLOWO2_01_FULL_47_25 TaxID=1802402 RepID=A0A1F7UUA2_9BACT|nr:MAG: hypothetical protein A2752_00420 [Candidatus Uhrbacteria bacterium RIFCSPHIGHO2_01_FULL_46_23]OGL69922.1 MAG: hypothetical protein A3D60_00070 [Candidatus Uhrbacteria bacterium RIFCSPHIGHO2_02_FULL_47_29]OGL81247.1 MAG: hypothetical protein A2936_03040 [Candidatus Uhrbacteria bacterium RIFCSPLOWO2_01_FULL_47_25]OGL86024.1 MAG: hypothetical protein A3I37_01380 [Candidatus Uhrbacteria bacterium RIFCSPLOWO2_02_FULL_46_19]
MLPAEHAKVQQLLFGTDKTIVSDWMRGKYTAEQVNEFVAREIGLPFEKLWSVFVQDCRTMKVSQPALEKLNTLRDQFTVVLLTGNMDSFSRFTVPALQLEKYFDLISNSYFEGKHKTDNSGELFVAYAQKIGVPLESCLLIDNSPRACAIFENLGGIAYLATPENDINYHLAQIQ